MSRVSLAGKTILVTGAAWFIGSNLIKRLCKDIEDVKIIGIDNMNNYYDVKLKEARLEKQKRVYSTDVLWSRKQGKYDCWDDWIRQYKKTFSRVWLSHMRN